MRKGKLLETLCACSKAVISSPGKRAYKESDIMEKDKRGRNKSAKYCSKANTSGQKRKRGKQERKCIPQSDSESDNSNKRRRSRDKDDTTQNESQYSGTNVEDGSSSYTGSEDSTEYDESKHMANSESDSETSEKLCNRKSTIKKKVSKAGDKQKKLRIKSQDDSDDVEEKSLAGSYRCHLPTTITELQKLRFKEIHLEVIKKTPFWLLFQSLHKCDERRLRTRCGKYFEDIRDIIDAYDEPSGKFIMGGKYVGLDVKDVELILGISGGNTPIYMKTKPFVPPSWVERCFTSELTRKGAFIITKKSILRKLSDMIAKRDDVNLLDVARLVHCYLMASIIAPLKNGSMAPKYTVYLEKFSDICDYDWCGFIVAMLKKQIIDRKSSCVGGCTILLPFWLCEHSSLVKPVNQLAFPRFLRWDLKDLNRKLSKERKQLPDLDRKYVKRYPLESTEHEKKTLKSLKKYWLSEGKATQNEQKLETGLQDNAGSSSGQGTNTGKIDYSEALDDEEEFVEATIFISTPTERRDKETAPMIDRGTAPMLQLNTMRSLNTDINDRDHILVCSTPGRVRTHATIGTEIVPHTQHKPVDRETRIEDSKDISPSMPENLFGLGIPEAVVPAQSDKVDEDKSVEFAVGYGISALENELLEAKKLVLNYETMMEEKDKIISDLNEEVKKMKDLMVDMEDKDQQLAESKKLIEF